MVPTILTIVAIVIAIRLLCRVLEGLIPPLKEVTMPVLASAVACLFAIWLSWCCFVGILAA